MAEKWSLDDIHETMTAETTFWVNPVEDSGYRYRATHLDGRRAPKVILSDDPKIRPGIPCVVRIKKLHKPKHQHHGFIEVEFVHALPFKLEGIYLDPVISKKLQILLESGLNILLDGPQGCGKTSVAKAIAHALGMRFIFFNCSAVIEATDFLATIQIRASEAGQPITDFIKTDFLRALEEAAEQPDTRYLIFLDEFNRCQESARNALMPALDTTRRIYHPINNSFFSIPDNVQFIAAVNRGNEFSGTFGIDAAQLDRFAPLQMDYLPAAEEEKLLHDRHPEVSKTTIHQIVEIANRIRRAPELSMSLSVRATEEACIYLKHPLFQEQQSRALPDVLKSSFCARFSGRWDDVNSDAGAVWAAIQDSLRVEKKKKKSNE
jgi:nitric oxide reductase NorQ protein